MSRYLSPALLVVGATCVVIAGIGLADDQATPSSFTSRWTPINHAAITPAQLSKPAAMPGAAISQPRVEPPATRAGVEKAPVTAVSPVRLSMPRLHVSAAIEPMTAADGQLGVPADVTAVGWWTASARPGSADGTTVIDGHVDSAAAGRGALFYLSRLKAGDAITIVTSDGGQLNYRVYSRQVYVKTHGLPSGLFTSGGMSRLAVISCGGPFDRATHSYLDNVVVLAEPAP